MKRIIAVLFVASLAACSGGEKIYRQTRTITFEIDAVDVVPGEAILIEERGGKTVEYPAKEGVFQVEFESEYAPTLFTISSKDIDGKVVGFTQIYQK